ncbi:MAG: glycosyltransferase family 2 protein [Clostridia bacterium]|nr:glycosyltransferase family 2 protein [Clostridia bacterium]
MRFSIIIPVYKIENYIRQCVHSILVQTMPDFELILVDDGSPDNSPSICDELAGTDDRIKVIHKLNGGPASARQAGAEIAAGDYICCVDGDDFVHPDYLLEMSAVIDANDPDVVCLGYEYYCDGDKVLSAPKDIYPFCREGYYERKQLEETIFPKLVLDPKGVYFLPSLCAKAIRRDIFITCHCRVDPSIRMGEDGACSIPAIMRASSLFIIKKNYYYYRVNESSLTKGGHCFNMLAPVKIYKTLSDAANDSGYDFSDQLYRKLAKAFFNAAVSQFNRGESYGTIKKDILNAMRVPEIKKSIKEAKFGLSIKPMAMMICLKLKLVFLMKLMNRFA